MRLVVDSPAVQHVEQTWPEFRRDPRHLRFGLAYDGVSPYGVKSSSHSTWPVVLTKYNVPPWLASKKGFLLLALIIQGPKKVKNIDIYLEPLVEELQQLWDGVDDVYDGRTERIGRDRWFTLKGVLLWTMHDYPGYAQVSGFQTSGYATCPTCRPALPVARSSHLSKQFYMSYSTYLPMDDPLRGTGAERNNVAPPIPLDMNWWEQRWRDVKEGHIPAERAGLKRWSILHRLPYWKYVLPICLQGLGTQDLRDAICDFSVLMRWVCSKTIRIAEIDEKELFRDVEEDHSGSLLYETSCVRSSCNPKLQKRARVYILLLRRTSGSWSQLVGPRPTIVHDDSGLMRVNTSSTLPFTRITDEPYIYPSLVEQCFYVECSDDPEWSVAIPYIPRERHIIQDRPPLTILVDLDPVEESGRISSP
ncbi:hypothetical protein R1sor_026147 [Riccia sorocarpa]|uniref:Uncharacterized protein n=1 Tax=Riccia sorocarpa TaxID=122646 RepID=A0ABD3GCM4_9MARC